MYAFFKNLLFLLPPETAHRWTMALLELAVAFPPSRWFLKKIYCRHTPEDAVEALGLRFPNRVGLAAGFDKDGKHIEALACLGFGHVEVGTVTPLPQAGNPQPRLFRLPADGALINRMGFNNEGLEALVIRLKRFREGDVQKRVVIGGNIGKNKDTPNEEAVSDYLKCFEALHPYVDYFTVNVSSPNTPGLRELQGKEMLEKILSGLREKNQNYFVEKPILLKIAPDLTEPQLEDVVEIVRKVGISGIIATNTTISRDNLRTAATEIAKIGPGGLSGTPLRQTSTQVVRFLRSKLENHFLIIGVGGIDSAESACEKLAAGADLLQVYTGFVYEGPSLISKIINSLRKRDT